MNGQTNIPQKEQLPIELTPRDDAKKMVSEVLKRVDQLMRKGDLERAELEISRAKELDPRNVYAFAMQERLSFLKNDFQKIAQRKIEEASRPSVVKNTTKVETETKNVKSAPIPAAVSTKAAPAQPSNATSAATKTQEPQQQERILDQSVELESYRKELTESWKDGELNEDKKRQLNELRLLLEITDSEHDLIEKKVKCDCYRNALLHQLSENPAILSNPRLLTKLQNKFNISDEDHMHVQTLLMNTIQFKHRDKVLVIDDDPRLLELLASSLEESGFDVTALPTSDEAYALLRKFVPDLILCDINLETSTMGGFTFYEKLQEIKSVQHVPFIFLTGLTDEALIRTGKELGVDDYLVKPISEQTLVSTIRGKLKRFRQLKKVMTTPMPALVAV